MACRDQREADRLARLCRAQGFRVKESRKGYVVYAKQLHGGLVGWHKTPSDYRSMRNTVALLRKIGVEL